MRYNWLSYDDAVEAVRHLEISSSKHWKRWIKVNELPEGIPRKPNEVYKGKGWISWGVFLGTGNIATKDIVVLPFEHARTYARSLNLNNIHEWRKMYQEGLLPPGLPSHADSVYKQKGWISWGDFLGTANVSPIRMNFLPYEEARDYMRKLKLDNTREFKAWAKSDARPSNIPSNPHSHYKDKGWEGYSEFLGLNFISTRKRHFLPYIEAREYMHALGLQSSKEFHAWAASGKRPVFIPGNPNSYYKNKGWCGYGDFLGANIAFYGKKSFLPFLEAREYMRRLNLKSKDEFKQWSSSENRPPFIPSHPEDRYLSEGWEGYSDFLGYEGRKSTQNSRWLSFYEAREIAISQAFLSKDEYKQWIRSRERPKDFPPKPDIVYAKKGWRGWNDFLNINPPISVDYYLRMLRTAHT